jgi:protocatechuate 3,4-dioxygenase beta subunit
MLVLGVVILLAAAARAADPPPHVATFWREGDAGERLEIRGRVLTPDFQPVTGAEVHVRQADGSGVYSAGYQGTMVTNERGEYVLRTAMPGNYGRPRHIHVSASHPDVGTVWTEIVFKGDPMLDERDREHAIALESVRVDGREHKVGTFDLVIGAN